MTELMENFKLTEEAVNIIDEFMEVYHEKAVYNRETIDKLSRLLMIVLQCDCKMVELVVEKRKLLKEIDGYIMRK